ncbi:dihydroorotase [Dethiothermospora halolimnae]|uniref:dihydroorotase n=1 Tax=Dethiothermospora halolimnae TaxID=3114390 RepID=UPI003CCBD251
MLDLIIKNAKIPKGENDTVATNILVKNEKISGFLTDIDGVDAKETIDAKGNLVIPGGFDSHTHFMDPGFTHRENFFTGSSSAAAGGITTIMDMPCCSKPSVRSVDQLHNKINAIKDDAIVDYALWGGVTGEDVREGNLHIVEEQAKEGVCAFKVYMTPSVPTYPRVTDPEMLEAFRAVAKTGLPIGVHAENFAMADFYTKKFEKEGRTDAPAWAEARNQLVEKVAIELVISFAEDTGARAHIVHMGSGVGAKLIGEAKKRGIDVTSETCPHYLILDYQDAMTEHGAFAKIAPPLKSKKDNQELWEGLINGSVDFIGTDHAPYEIITEKAKDGMTIWDAFPGIPGVETMMPILISEGYNKGRLTLRQLVNVTSTNAAINYGIYPKKGSMEIGSDADLTIVDLDYEWTIDQEKTFSKAKYNPLHGTKVKGRPIKTILRGKVIFDLDKGIVGEKGYGKFVKRQRISKLPKCLRYASREDNENWINKEKEWINTK